MDRFQQARETQRHGTTSRVEDEGTHSRLDRIEAQLELLVASFGALSFPSLDPVTEAVRGLADRPIVVPDPEDGTVREVAAMLQQLRAEIAEAAGQSPALPERSLIDLTDDTILTLVELLKEATDRTTVRLDPRDLDEVLRNISSRVVISGPSQVRLADDAVVQVDTSGRTLTQRMLNKELTTDYRWWVDDQDPDFIYMAEAPLGSDPAVDAVWRGIRLPQVLDGSQGVAEAEGFVWTDRAAAGWVD